LKKSAGLPDVIAIGEAGFDRLRGPAMKLQHLVFEEQIAISEELRNRFVIHCVRAWMSFCQLRKITTENVMAGAWIQGKCCIGKSAVVERDVSFFLV